MSIRRGLQYRSLFTLAGTTGFALLLMHQPARAFNYEFNDGVKIEFDNTLQYSLLERTSPELPVFQNNVNINDGDNNLRSGIVSNRIDLLTKFNIDDNGYGFDTTIDSFYDSVYNQHTQNHSTYTYNPATTPSTSFPSATRTLAGRDVQLRNLFIYGSNSVAGIPVTVRVGRLVNLFGESLFFASNGIAYGNGPVDVERAISVPNTQVKDLLLPVGQATISAQLTNSISATAYYQFEWEKFNFIPVGSYFSTVDLLDAGGQRLIAFPGSATTPGGYFYRTPDKSGADTGQYGLAVHYDPVASEYDLGLYALQYNDSEPQIYTRPGAGAPGFIPGTPAALVLGTYQLVYPDHIQIYGASASTTVGPANFAGEISARTNEPLVSTVTVLPGEAADNDKNARYAKGDTLHYQASTIYLGPQTKYWNSSSFLAEVAGVNLLEFTKNRDAFNRTQRHMALGFRAVASVEYYQVLPGFDVEPSIGLGYNFMGLAPDTAAFNGTGIDRGGDITFGVTGLYLANWEAAVTYTNYIAPPGRNQYADRDFVAFNIERTF